MNTFYVALNLRLYQIYGLNILRVNFEGNKKQEVGRQISCAKHQDNLILSLENRNEKEGKISVKINFKAGLQS